MVYSMPRFYPSRHGGFDRVLRPVRRRLRASKARGPGRVRRARPLRRVPAMRRSLRPGRPELKQISASFPVNLTNGFPTVTFNYLYPNDLTVSGGIPSSTNWVGTAGQSPTGIWYPGQGVGLSQRIGNKICMKGLYLNLNFYTGTSGVRYRFVLFKWKIPVSPDLAGINWYQPCGVASGSSFGAGFNVDVPAVTNDYIKVMYQTTWRSHLFTDEGNIPTNGDEEGAATTAVSWYKHNVRKLVKLNYVLPVENQTEVPTRVDASATTPTESNLTSLAGYRGRLYWCVVTDYDATREPDAGGTVHGVSGIVRVYYTDP